MSITIGSPPVRPAYKIFTPTTVSFSAGRISVDVDVQAPDSTVIGKRSIVITPGSIIGLRYVAVSGELEGFSVNDASVTVVAAFNAFVGQAGGFANKADALLAYIQSKAGLPT